MRDLRRTLTLSLLLLLLIQAAAAAPLGVEIQKLLGASTTTNTTVTDQGGQIQKQQSAFSVFGGITEQDGVNIVRPGEDLTFERNLIVNGNADFCVIHVWLESSGAGLDRFNTGSKHYPACGEAERYSIPFEAPQASGTFDITFKYGYWPDGDSSPYWESTAGFDQIRVAEDSDGDGVWNFEDDCINQEGDEDYNGCPPPDSDNDGIPDDEDDCINEAGPSETDGCPDTDSDGVRDSRDEFPNDSSCQEDSDGDGVCNSEDAFPNDPSETEDSDGDGVGDNADEFPNDPECSEDSDQDNVCDSQDAFPNDSGKTSDQDGDGVADSVDSCVTRSGPERFDGCPDTDGDGVPVNKDLCKDTSSKVSQDAVDEDGCPVSVPGDGSDDEDNDDTDSNDQVGTDLDRKVFAFFQNLIKSFNSIF